MRHFNPVHAIGVFLYPLEISETSGFLIFSGGIKKDHEKGHEMVWSRLGNDQNTERNVGERERGKIGEHKQGKCFIQNMLVT